MTDYSNKTRVLPGSAFYCYSDEEVVWVHDADHTPFRSRQDADLKVEVRAPIFQGAVNHVNFLATETTRIKGGKIRSQVISITIPTDQFDKIVAHVRRKPDQVPTGPTPYGVEIDRVDGNGRMTRWFATEAEQTRTFDAYTSHDDSGMGYFTNPKKVVR